MRYNVSRHDSWILWAVIAATILLLLAPRSAHGQPVIFSAHTHRSTDTLYVGERAFISFDVDGQGADIQGMVFPLEFSFAAGSLMGAMPGDVTGVLAPQFHPVFAPPEWTPFAVGLDGTDPDTLLFGVITFDSPWTTNGTEWVARLHFQPKDSGHITIDSITLPPANQLAALNPLAQNWPLVWNSPGIVVLPCPNVLGDVNQNGLVTAADVIAFVKCVFTCGPGTFPPLELGDVNCSGDATVADAIALVNYVFKSTSLPFCCNVLD